MTAPQTSAPPAGDVPHETGDHDSRVGNVVITGQATLAQIAASTGLSVEMICDRAGLPRDIPAEMTLGRLRRRHGIQIQAIRDAVAELLKNRESLVPSEGRRNPDR